MRIHGQDLEQIDVEGCQAPICVKHAFEANIPPPHNITRQRYLLCGSHSTAPDGIAAHHSYNTAGTSPDDAKTQQNNAWTTDRN